MGVMVGEVMLDTLLELEVLVIVILMVVREEVVLTEDNILNMLRIFVDKVISVSLVRVEWPVLTMAQPITIVMVEVGEGIMAEVVVMMLLGVVDRVILLVL